MQNYQNYFPMYQQPQINPYMQRMENLQQFQQAINQPQIQQMPATNQFQPLGKIVDSIDIVKATDIPMDGNMYYFPKADGTEIYTKQWLQNGTTQILSFKAILDSEPSNSMENANKLNLDTINVVLDGIQNELQVLTNKIDELSKAKTTSRVKKEE